MIYIPNPAAWLCFLVVLAMPGVALATAEQARDFVRTLGDDVIDVVEDPTLSNGDKETRLQTLFREGVDVPWIGRFVLGRHWRTATEAQKEQYLAFYEQFLMKAYVSRFTEYTGETFDISDVRPKGDNEYIVQTLIKRPKSEDVRVDYRVRATAGSPHHYQVVDIIAEGVSLLTTQRSEFGSVISRRGLDHLIALLEKRANKG